MTENKRIFLNIVATYGRSLYSLAIGLICGRWTLMALGEVDYGLLGVIGGLTIMIDYFNTIIVGAISRFYAISVGKERSDPIGGLEECHRWFTTAVMIQVTWPTLLLLVGYPIGIWAIYHFLTIPVDRVGDCVWVWRLVCCSSYVSMITVPLKSMYNAKQYIAELTLYSFAVTTLGACFTCYMVTHPGVWMVRAAIWGCLMSVGPGLIIAVRAVYLFPECRFKLKYAKCWASIKELGCYGFWNALGIFGSYMRGQGVTIFVNKFFGPRINAGVAIGQTVSGHCTSLSGSLEGAFGPAIYNAWGSGDYEKARQLGYRVCKIGTFLIMIFALPLMLEIDEVLGLWLKNPPPFAAPMCVFVSIETMVTKISIGHLRCIDANGRIAKFQVVESMARIAVIPVSIALIAMGVGVYAVGWGLVSTICISAINRVLFAHKLVGMSIRYWVSRILFPLIMVIVAGLTVGSLPRWLMVASFVRVCVTTLVVEITILPISWAWVLNAEEKEYIADKVNSLILRITR